MKFRLSDEQRALQDAVATFAAAECEGGARRRAFESESGFDAAFWKGLADLGVLGIHLPADRGGMGLEMLELALAAEALGYAAAPGPFLGHVLAAHALARCGDVAVRAAWLPRLASGTATATVALAEPGERYRPDQWRLAPVGGRLSGTKHDVPYAELADLIVVGVRGGFALIEKGAPGVAFEPRDGTDRTRRLSHLILDDAPATFVAAPEADLAAVHDAALVLLAADAFGGARRCLDMAVAHAKTREQFGGVIGRFQGLKHQLADLAVEVEPARGLYWYAAHAYDREPAERSRIAHLAKAHLGETFMHAARANIEVHGGLGYTWEHDAQIWFKRAMFDFAWLGAPSRHRERVAALAGW